MDAKIYALSIWKYDQPQFSQLICDIYQMISFLAKDYKDFQAWYYGKAVAGIFEGKTEFFLAFVNNQLVGLLIAKKGIKKRKICTLFVKPGYRLKGIGSALIDRALKYLGTQHPSITFADYKSPYFTGILRKYKWEVTDKKFNSHNNHYELICNK